MPPLTATYNSATTSTTHTFSRPLPTASANATTEERTNYLAALRSSVTEVQDEINTFLTQKMEEDKANATAVGGEGSGKAKVDEEREEEGYGDEEEEDEG